MDAGAPDADLEELAAFERFVQRAQDDMSTHAVPGVQIAVVVDGELRYTAALGTRGREDDRPVDDDTRFRLASLTKMTIGATAAELAAEDAFDLDAPIREAIPTFSTGGDVGSMTLAHLLTHTAALQDIGLPTWLTCDQFETLGEAFTGGNEPPWHGVLPGIVWNYSNVGYAAVGYAIELAAGAPHDQVVSERILGPAGMTRATFSTAEALADGNVATGMYRGETVAGDLVTCSLWGPPAGLWGTATDLARFAEVLLADGGDVLEPGVAGTLGAPHAETGINPVTTYGYGLYRIEDYSGLVLNGHDGVLPGFYGSMYLAPERGFAVVVVSNSTDWNPNPLALAGLRELLGIEEPVRMWSTDPATWGEYAGTYCSWYSYGRVIVSYDGDSLAVSMPDLQDPPIPVVDVPLTQVAVDAFAAQVAGETIPVRFWREQDGEAPRWFVDRGGIGDREVTCPVPRVAPARAWRLLTPSQ